LAAQKELERVRDAGASNFFEQAKRMELRGNLLEKLEISLFNLTWALVEA
jgi:hypothetical protein